MPESVDSVQDVPVCPGCGLMSHIRDPPEICQECFQRGERRAEGGGLVVVTPSMTGHETPLCPAVQVASEWRYWREEDCCYASMSGDLDRCLRCYNWRYTGFAPEEEFAELVTYA